jgi:5-methylcytosine-specific restriction endonuclease McrA
MPGLPRACTVCGRRVADGRAKCEEHQGQHYAQPVACRICGLPGPKSFCAVHDPLTGSRSEEERLARQPWRRGYRDPNYHRERQAVVSRARGCCEVCGRKASLEVDHIIPLSTAKSPEELQALNRRENLRALCKACHRMRTLRRGSWGRR